MKLPAQLNIPIEELNQKVETPLFVQLYSILKKQILHGKLVPGSKLPSTRALANALKISRNTVLTAYDQLLAEGYISSKVGDATRVSEAVPEAFIQLQTKPDYVASSKKGKAPRGALLMRSKLCADGIWKKWQEIKPFRTGVPPYDIFPMKLWCQLLLDCQKHARSSQLSYGSGMGYLPLRRAISKYLAPARGISCQAENIAILSSSHHAIDLAIRALSSPGESAYFENPGYPGAKHLLTLAGVKILPLELDSQGPLFPKKTRKANLLFTTPSHQFPTGIIMSLERRMELLAWSERNNIAIIEDDYSGEYRFRERPLPALKALDTQNRVFHIGTFSKVTFPSLRVGYLVIPDHYREEFEHLLSLLESAVPTPTQMALTRFIEEGHYERHLKKVRKLAFQRKELLVHLLEKDLPKSSSFFDGDAGMHLLLRLPEKCNDKVISNELLAKGIQTLPLSECYSGKSRPGLILHYAGFSESRLREACKNMCDYLRAGNWCTPARFY